MAAYQVISDENYINCSCNYAHNENILPSKDIIIIADTGYYFKDNFTYMLNFNTRTFNKSENGKQLILRATMANNDVYLIDTYRAVEAPTVTYTVTKHLNNCTVDIGDTITSQTGLKITFTVGGDNLFFTAPTVKVGDTTHTAHIITGNKSAYVYVDITDNVVVSGVAEPEKPKIFITGSFENCTCNYNHGDRLMLGNVVLSANDGYEFRNTETAYVMNGETMSMVKSEDSKTLTIDISTVTHDITLNLAYIADSDYIPPEPTYEWRLYIEGTLINCAANFNNGEIITGDLIIRANSGYKFNGVHTCTINWGTEHLHLLEDDTVLKLGIRDVTGDVYLEDEYKGVPIGGVEPEPEPEPEPKHMVTITGSFINCTCNFKNNDLIDKAIEITANDGYTFKGVYTYTINYGTETFTITNGGKTLIIPYNRVTANVYLDDEYKATEKVTKLGGMANLYMVSDDVLVELSRNRIVISDNFNVDYGAYITNLYILPFKLPDNLIGTRDSIILGNHDTNIETTLINDYMFTFDGGTIDIPNKYHNIYDYVNTECILHLPFLDNVYLPTEYVINQSISISFIIELYSGTITMNVTSTFNNEIIATRKGIIGISIPFIQRSTGTISNVLSDVYSNLIDRCFIEVKRNIPYTRNTDLFGSTVIEFGTISDYEGFIQCEDVQLITDATNQEQTEIINLLNKGVYI